MKAFPLSTAKERVLGICASALFIACLVLLLYTLRGNLIVQILCGLFTVLLTVLLGFYVISSFKSVCILDAQNKTLELRGYPGFTKDLSEAVLVQSLPRRSGHMVTRVLVFSDAQENPIAVVPTLFTHRRGMQAEPMAREMAEYLGIAFRENIPAWEYDKEAFKQHQKEEAEAEKAARKERIEQRRQKLLHRYGKK